LKTIAFEIAKILSISQVIASTDAQIQITSPRTDLCDTCQHFYNNARKEEEVRDLLKKYTKNN